MADNAILFPRKVLESLIAAYREHPCLWDRTHPQYKVKMRRHQALTELTDLVRQWEPTVTRVHVLRKLDSLRACVRREHKRVMASRRRSRGGEGDEGGEYQPALWYYHMFTFLLNDTDTEQQNHQDDTSAERLVAVSVESDVESADSAGESGAEGAEGPYDEEYQLVAVHGGPAGPRRDEGPPNKRSKQGTVVDDEYDAIGVYVAAKLRALQPSMRILAEKLIHEVVYQAQAGALTAATTVHTPDPFTHHTT